MNGTVAGLHLDNAVIETEYGFTLLQFMCSHNTEVGDRVSGPFTSEASQTMTNHSKNQSVRVSIENAGCGVEQAREWLRH